MKKKTGLALCFATVSMLNASQPRTLDAPIQKAADELAALMSDGELSSDQMSVRAKILLLEAADGVAKDFLSAAVSVAKPGERPPLLTAQLQANPELFKVLLSFGANLDAEYENESVRNWVAMTAAYTSAIEEQEGPDAQAKQYLERFIKKVLRGQGVVEVAAELQALVDDESWDKQRIVTFLSAAIKQQGKDKVKLENLMKAFTNKEYVEAPDSFGLGALALAAGVGGLFTFLVMKAAANPTGN